MRAAGHKTGLIGGVELRVGEERLASSLTTPEAPDLQALFAVMVERGVTCRRDGGVESLAGPGPGRRLPPSTWPSSPTCRRTTWISTPT